MSVLHLDVNSRRVDIDAGQEETTVEATLEELAHEIHSSVGVRMHRLGVVVWEVKLWMAACAQANGAWRIVVNNVTGHTCTVHVSPSLKGKLSCIAQNFPVTRKLSIGFRINIINRNFLGKPCTYKPEDGSVNNEKGVSSIYLIRDTLVSL